VAMMGPSSAWGMMRSMRRRDELGGKKIGRETALRVMRFAKPYRWVIAIFLVLVIASSIIAVVTPVLAGDVINVITRPEGDDPGAQVVRIALVIAGLAVVDAVLTWVQRLLSSRIGEGIILNLRTQVYDHVQRMPLQFFTRTQTGALVSRLNNDVIGAQQAFTRGRSATSSRSS
jgi:ATP-binding cassette, subfamily B, bacterial